MRLFVALRPPRAVREMLLAAAGGVGGGVGGGVDGGVDGARWQTDEQLHLTLRFLGEVDARAADDLCAGLGSLRIPAPEARIAGAGLFDRRGRPDTLWAGLCPCEPLAALHRKVDRAARAAGLGAEGRAFVPHVTLARLGRGADAAAARAWVASRTALASPAFRFDRLLLYRSHLGSEGASYEVLDAWPLARA